MQGRPSVAIHAQLQTTHLCHDAIRRNQTQSDAINAPAERVETLVLEALGTAPSGEWTWRRRAGWGSEGRLHW